MGNCCPKPHGGATGRKQEESLPQPKPKTKISKQGTPANIASLKESKASLHLGVDLGATPSQDFEVIYFDEENRQQGKGRPLFQRRTV